MTPPAHAGPATPGAAVDALWASLRLVVVDVETLIADGTSPLIKVAVAPAVAVR